MAKPSAKGGCIIGINQEKGALTMEVAKARGSAAFKVAGLLAVLLTLMLAFSMAGCSSTVTKNSKGEEMVNGYTVKEYNSDIDNLERILNNVKSLKSRIDAMGDPNAFTSQSQVDQYNSLVDQYNSAASEYNSAAKAFTKKYGSTIDGAGTKPTDPENIDLPQKR